MIKSRIIVTFDPYMVQGPAGFAVAAKEAQLEHIVSLTQWLASPSNPSLNDPPALAGPNWPTADC
jgi:hypothetical protein